jgi:hypothetical protein
MTIAGEIHPKLPHPRELRDAERAAVFAGGMAGFAFEEPAEEGGVLVSGLPAMMISERVAVR